jgi:hypothetical protein
MFFYNSPVYGVKLKLAGFLFARIVRLYVGILTLCKVAPCAINDGTG